MKLLTPLGVLVSCKILAWGFEPHVSRRGRNGRDAEN